MARSRGLNTLFWLDFASEFACTFDHSIEINVPQWASALPFVSGVVLEHCGGGKSRDELWGGDVLLLCQCG